MWRESLQVISALLLFARSFSFSGRLHTLRQATAPARPVSEISGDGEFPVASVLLLKDFPGFKYNPRGVVKHTALSAALEGGSGV